jgi:hypothetical protein
MNRRTLGRFAAPLVVLALLVSLWPDLTAAAPRQFGMLYHDGEIVRTFGVPARLPHGGTDPLFTVTNGVEGQLGITTFAPGDPGYSGGDWAVYEVTFTGAPYLLTSDEAVRAAEMAGDITVMRVPERDFRCPVQP